jgi:hypothetical protein
MAPLDHRTRHLLVLRVRFGDPEREAEWNAWYDDDHVPAMLGVPGFVSCRRYKDLGHDGEYLTVYEIEGVDPCYSEECLRVSGWGEWKPYIAEWRRAVYELAHDFAR